MNKIVLIYLGISPNLRKLLLCFLFATLQWLAWFPRPLVPLQFISFIPIFLLIEEQFKRKLGFFLWTYLALFLWNLATTWWVFYSTVSGAVLMLIFNSLFMCIPIIIFKNALKKFSIHHSLLIFILVWVAYEFLHHRWDASWPWLTLGNSLSAAPNLVQWYEYTGTLGGTIWILLGNAFLWFSIKYKTGKSTVIFATMSLFLIGVSWLLLFMNKKISNEKEIVITISQPSFDPWNEKFARSSTDMLQEIFKEQLKGKLDSSQLVLLPETSITSDVDVNDIQNNANSVFLQNILHENKNLEILTGADMYSDYGQANTKPTSSARYDKNYNVYYDVYNSAIFYPQSGKPSFYHKSKLVPGTEQLPFVDVLPIMNKIAFQLDENSTTGTLGKSREAIVLGDKIKFAPIICYESIYGEYISEFIKKGAQIICIMTNDAWWKNTDGYKQHAQFAILRAIESRKWIARSANTGISCFISPTGTMEGKTNWFEKTSITKKIPANNKITFYTRYGDYLGRIATVIVLLYLSIIYSITIIQKIKKLTSNRIPT